jgi:hypothetical protein
VTNACAPAQVRRREGVSRCAERPASAKHIGVQGADQFRPPRQRTARPASAGQRSSSKFNVPAKRIDRFELADSDKIDQQLLLVTRGRKPRDVSGLIVADREFTWALCRRGRPGSSTRDMLDARKKPADKSRELSVGRTLEKVKEDYFPVSRLWSLRDKAAAESVSSGFARASGGSFVVHKGQHAKHRARSTALLGRVSVLKRQVAVADDKLSRIRREFVSLSNRTNPRINFPTFIGVSSLWLPEQRVDWEVGHVTMVRSPDIEYLACT